MDLNTGLPANSDEMLVPFEVAWAHLNLDRVLCYRHPINAGFHLGLIDCDRCVSADGTVSPLVQALLSVNQGAPRRRKLVLAKYGEWESIIGGIMDEIAPEAKFLADHLKNTLALDGEKDETIAFLMQLMIVFPRCGETAITVSQVVEKIFPAFATSRPSAEPNLRDFLPDRLSKSTESSFAKRLGKWMVKVSTRRWGTIEVVADWETHKGIWTYRVGENIKRKPPTRELHGLFENDETEAA